MSIQKKSFDLFTEHVRCTFLVMASFVFMRVLEISYRYFSIGEATDPTLLFTRSINFDLLFVLLASATSLIPICPLQFISVKASQFAIKTIALIIIFVNTGLTHYFLSTGSLLTGQVFSFSLTDIGKIVLGEWSIGRAPLWLISLSNLTLAYWMLFHWRPETKKKTHTIGSVGYALLLIVALFNTGHTFKEARYFDSYSKYSLGNCKVTYLLRSSYEASKKQNAFALINPEEVKRQTALYSAQHGDVSFLDPNYPFLHARDTANVLGPFFKPFKSKPNIVIVISESLSSVLSGSHTKWGSLTPFTDSLMRNGLSWSYFYSNAQKSYGVLPNLLASAPQGLNERGFINTEQEYPAHRKYPLHDGLLELQGQNGYTRNYYYGGWGYFDNAGYYLKEQGIDHFVSQDEFDKAKYKKSSAMTGELVWGFNDKQLFQQAMDRFDIDCGKEPWLSVFQTLTCHSPYDLAERNYFDKAFINQRLQKLHIDPKILQELDANIISCTLFADDALRDFFEAMKGKPGFENTIFIITGDHSLGLQNDADPLRNFHVPLIIWSLMLSKSADFKGVCSHVDVLPSLASLLSKSPGFNTPSRNAWIGRGLDTAGSFRSRNAFPLSLHAMDLPNYLSGEFVTQGESVYRLKANNTFEAIQNEQKRDSIQGIMKTFRFLNNVVCIQDRIQKETTSKAP